MRTFRTWAVDLVFNDGEKATAYWDTKAGMSFWNIWSEPDWPAIDNHYNDHYKDMDAKSYSDVYAVDITVMPPVLETKIITLRKGYSEIRKVR